MHKRWFIHTNISSKYEHKKTPQVGGSSRKAVVATTNHVDPNQHYKLTIY